MMFHPGYLRGMESQGFQNEEDTDEASPTPSSRSHGQLKLESEKRISKDKFRRPKTAKNNLLMLRKAKLVDVDSRESGFFKINLSSVGLPTLRSSNNPLDVTTSINVPLYMSPTEAKKVDWFVKNSVEFLNNRKGREPGEDEADDSSLPPFETDLSKISEEDFYVSPYSPMQNGGIIQVVAILPRSVIAVDPTRTTETVHNPSILVPVLGTQMEFRVDKHSTFTCTGTVTGVDFAGRRYTGKRIAVIEMSNISVNQLRGEGD